jgi:hypothetical protein
MKPIIFLLISLFAFNCLKAQEIDTLKKVRYAVEVSGFKSGSGFMPGTAIFFTYKPQYNRSISLGFFYCYEQKKISGISVRHEIALTSSERQKLTPYLFYNMLYRFTRTSIENEQPTESTYGLYKSMEHHIGLGLNAKISKNIDLKTAMGYGVYFGSIKKPVMDPVTKEISGSNGFCPIGTVTLSYTF